MDKKIFFGIGILVIAMTAVFFLRGENSLTGKAVETGVISEPGMIKIPRSSITKDAKWYSYDSGKTEIKYFLVRTKDGSIKSAFDACDVCYSAKKGYRQEGGDMICNNCGNHYRISDLGSKNKAGGGCWPGYLPSRVEGEYLVIQKSDLNAGEYRFL